MDLSYGLETELPTSSGCFCGIERKLTTEGTKVHEGMDLSYGFGDGASNQFRLFLRDRTQINHRGHEGARRDGPELRIGDGASNQFRLFLRDRTQIDHKGHEGARRDGPELRMGDGASNQFRLFLRDRT